MDAQIGKLPTRKKRRPSYLNAILMVSLVLFLLGSIGLLLLNAQIVGRSLKESVRISAYLKDNVNEVEMLQLRKKIEAEPFVRETRYISKQDAVEQFLRRSDEDIREILGEVNPLPASFEIGLDADWVYADSIASIAQRLESYREIKFVKANTNLVIGMNQQFRTIGIVLIAVSVLFFIIVVTLIDKSIRLAMYANRFIIRSMQLVGATRWFIIRPYIQRSIINGLISGILAVAVLFGIQFLIRSELTSLDVSGETYKFALLFVGIILFGILLSWWSTQHAVSKYLRMKLDDLY